MFIYGNDKGTVSKTFNAILRVALTVGGFSSICIAFFREKFEPLVKCFFLPALGILSILLVPRTTVTIQDHLVQKVKDADKPALITVEHVPFFLGKFASLVSTVSYNFNLALEGVSHGTDDAMYNWTGHIYAAENIGLERPEEAIPHYQRALALDQNYADAWRNLGFAWQATGRIEEARAAFKTAIAIAPSIPSLYHGLISCTQLPPGDPHLAAMETILPKADALPVSERILLHFALAKALDDVGQPERAAQHLLIGNMIKRRELAYDEGAMLDLLARIQATFTPPMMEAEKSTKEGREPRPLFIIGMPRSGTTLVEQILASHQAIVGGGELPALRRAIEETLGKGNYPEAIPTITSGNLHKIGERYLSALRALFPRATHVVDKMPFNFLYVGIISLALPQARIIHIRRDPADTCFSCFSLLFKGELPFAYNLSELGRYYRAYERLMAHWRTVLPAGAMLEVSYEALVTDLESEARRLVAYCGLEWDPACLSFDKTKRVVLTASAAQVRRPIYRSSIGRWRRYRFMLAPLLAAMERTEYESQSCEREPEHRSSAHRL